MSTNVVDSLIDYSRQRDMEHDLGALEQTHIIVGCGGIGYWLAIQLALLGHERLVLIDADKIESSNLNRLPAPLRSRGEYKVKVLKAQLRMMRPTVHVTCLPVHITEDTLQILHDIKNTSVYNLRIWDCTDDARIQRILSTCARNNMYLYSKAGYEKWNVGLYSHMQDVWLQDNYTPGYTTSAANAISSMMAAGLAILYAGQNEQEDISIDLKELVHTGNARRTDE